MTRQRRRVLTQDERICVEVARFMRIFGGVLMAAGYRTMREVRGD